MTEKKFKGCGKYFPNTTKKYKNIPNLICGYRYRSKGKRRLCPDCEEKLRK